MYKRWVAMGKTPEQIQHAGFTALPWTVANAQENVICHWDRLEIPLKWKSPKKIFINSMSDWLHPLVPIPFIDAMLEVMMACPQHVFQALTKRTENMERMLYEPTEDTPVRALGGGDYLSNLWMGCSVENRREKHRIDELRQIPAAIRFISFEPLLEDLGELDLTGIHWCIVGAESGPGRRPFNLDWARSIRDQCVVRKIPFFFKQDSGYRPETNPYLDGKRWEESPQIISRQNAS
jgi:protein gp37